MGYVLRNPFLFSGHATFPTQAALKRIFATDILAALYSPKDLLLLTIQSQKPVNQDINAMQLPKPGGLTDLTTHGFNRGTPAAAPCRQSTPPGMADGWKNEERRTEQAF